MENWREKELGFANFLHQNVRFGRWIAIEFKYPFQHLEKKNVSVFWKNRSYFKDTNASNWDMGFTYLTTIAGPWYFW